MMLLCPNTASLHGRGLKTMPCILQPVIKTEQTAGPAFRKDATECNEAAATQLQRGISW